MYIPYYLKGVEQAILDMHTRASGMFRVLPSNCGCRSSLEVIRKCERQRWDVNNTAIDWCLCSSWGNFCLCTINSGEMHAVLVFNAEADGPSKNFPHRCFTKIRDQQQRVENQYAFFAVFKNIKAFGAWRKLVHSFCGCYDAVDLFFETGPLRLSIRSPFALKQQKLVALFFMRKCYVFPRYLHCNPSPVIVRFSHK